MGSFYHGSPLLMGDNTIPGVRVPKDFAELIPKILRACSDYGLDFFPTVVQMMTHDEISEIAAFGGFPVRYPHWQFGMEFEQLQRGYDLGMHRIYELVTNTNPCYIYCLNSNNLLDNVMVVAHATGHNDFFKNNIYFAGTHNNSQCILDKMANHSSRIRKYMSRWGEERITQFIDQVLQIQSLIDPGKAWNSKKDKEVVVRDSRKYFFPRRLKTDHDYMDPFVNTQDFMDEEYARVEKKEIAEELDLFEDPTRDILGFLRDCAPFKPWQADIVSMLYDEAVYFRPQAATKVTNEGRASQIDYEIMCRQGFQSLCQKEYDGGIVHYAQHKMGTLGGKYSMNPYALGFSLFLDIEDRWNKGRFGSEFDDCKDIQKKQAWNTNLGLGKEKTFEVRKNYDDVLLINEFFTQDFCDKNEFYEWKHNPDGTYTCESRDARRIKKLLMQRHVNGGYPSISLTDPNHRGKGYMFLQHDWEGRTLEHKYLLEVMCSIRNLWGQPVLLATRDRSGEEIVYICHDPVPESISPLKKEEYVKRLEES